MRIDKNIVSLQPQIHTVVIAQLVRASDCGSEGRGFESRFPPGLRLHRSLSSSLRFVLGNHVFLINT